MFLLGVCRTKRFNLTSPKKTKGYPNQAGHEQFGKSSSSKENGFKRTLGWVVKHRWLIFKSLGIVLSVSHKKGKIA